MRENYLRGGYGYGHAKKALFEIYQRKFGPFRERREYLVAHPEEVEAVLQACAEKARAQARITLNAARQAAGLE
jgi:tryptophanyl-tRNA synthetase